MSYDTVSFCLIGKVRGGTDTDESRGIYITKYLNELIVSTLSQFFTLFHLCRARALAIQFQNRTTSRSIPSSLFFSGR